MDSAKDLTTLRRMKGPRSGLATAFAIPVLITALVGCCAVKLASPSAAQNVSIGFLVATAAVAIWSGFRAARPLRALLDDVDAMARGNQPRGGASGSGEIAALSSAMRDMWRNLERGERLRQDLLTHGEDERNAAALWHEIHPTAFVSPDGYTVSAAHRIEGGLASSLVAWIPSRDGKHLALLLEASGQGTAGALLLSTARAYARALAPQVGSPREFLTSLNSLLAPELPHGTFVTAACALIDPTTGEGVYASAGHRVSALRVHARGSARRLQTEGIALGFDSTLVFDNSLGEASFVLESGEALVLAGEGLAMLSSGGAAVGEAGIARAVISALSEDPSSIAASALAAIAKVPTTNDLGILVVARKNRDRFHD